MKVFLLIVLFPIANSFASTLDFFSSLAEIKNRNTQSDVADAEVDLAKANRLEAYAQFLPSFELSASRAKDYRPETTAVDSVYLNSNLNLFRFGADFMGIKSSQHQTNLAFEKKKASDLNIESDAYNALIQYIFHEQNLNIIDQSLKIKEEYHATSKKRAARAIINDQDVDKIFIDLSNLKSQREETYLLFLKAKANLLALLENTEIDLNWPFQKYFTELDLKKLSQFNFEWQEALSFKMASQASRKEEASLSRSRLAFLPTIDLSFSTGYDKLQSQTAKDYDSRAVVSLNIPLFENFSDYSSYKGQVYNYYKSLAEQKDISRSLKESLSEKREGLIVAINAAINREKILKMARGLYKRSLDFFNRGRISVDNLQRDQERLLESEYFAQKAWLSAHQSFKDFCHLMGFEIESCRQQF